MIHSLFLSFQDFLKHKLIYLQKKLYRYSILNYNIIYNIYNYYKLIPTIFMKQSPSLQNPLSKTPIKLSQQLRLKFLQQFLQKNKNNLTKYLDFHHIMATIIPDTINYLPILGQLIKNGQLVAFPTQTVYGLGGDARNQHALLQIYKVKNRPLTDPIIVHVLDQQQALQLIIPQSQLQLNLFKILTNKYWPGPLTIILKSNINILPNIITSSTGYVGLRAPKCQYARQLLSYSQCPIGAPSANLFNHVSPTSPIHVFNDFFDQNITIVNGQICQFGVESTVVKICGTKLQIYRQGSLSVKKLQQFILKQFGQSIQITIHKKIQQCNENNGMISPGQMIKHYAPYLPCFTTTSHDLENSSKYIVRDNVQNQLISWKQIGLISFSSDFYSFKNKFKFYLSVDELDLQQLGCEVNEEQNQKFCTLLQKKQMRSLYYLLRKAQNLDIKIILIGWNDKKQGTLWDKIFRSSQGCAAQLL